MKYLIHCCNKRLWYVNDYLIPSLVEQGIDIIVYNDENNDGNLTSWYKSCQYVRDNLELYDGCWHLQDDVLICKDFKERTKNPPLNDIVCGYVGKFDIEDGHDLKGKQNISCMPYSFQCIWIPNRFIYGFVNWFEREVISGKRMQFYYKRNKYDDFFFKKFMTMEHKYTFSYALEENLVEHIDYIIGGAIVNPYMLRKKLNNTAVNFKDKDLVEKLKIEMEGRL